MKNFKLFLIFEFTLLYFELLFKVINFGFSFNVTFLYTILFITIISLVLSIICGAFKPKVNRILSYVSLGLITLWFGIEIVFKQIFNTFFSLSVFTIADQATSFIGTAVQETIKNIFYIILLIIPIILIIVFRKKIKYKKVNVLSNSIVLLVYILGMIFGLNVAKGEANNLFYKVNNLDINMDRFGVLITTYLDLKKTVFGFEEEININTPEPEEKEPEEEKPKEYSYNIQNYDFEKLNNETKDKNIKSITSFVMNDKGTKQNEYTGMFKGKNLVFFMAESFNEIAVREDLTPTLYKLVNSGFVFENFYTPLNLSTIGGEYQDLTGLMANSSILSTWRKGKNYFPYGLGNVFNDLGYQVQAYHNNSYKFQDRNKYLAAIGFKTYLGRYNGLEKRMKFPWPASDLDMVNVTIDDYINSDTPFMTYYVTVSGHMGYKFSENNMARKNKEYVNDLPYPEEIKGYLATQIELDKALESLIEKLKEAGKLEDTVIVLVADHYPYALSLNDINKAASYTKDGVIEINRSNLILWNSEMETVNVSKVASQIDVIPTVYNLFGIEYDSRLFIGKDILSDEPGLAMFSNRSWVSDYGKYYSNNKKFVPNEGVDEASLEENYVKNMNNEVSNRLNISKLIMSKDYYKVASNYLIKEETKENNEENKETEVKENVEKTTE